MANKDTSSSVLYPFPNKRIAESKKTNDKEYHKQWAKGIHTLFIEGRAGITESDRQWMRLMRLYGSGNQPHSLYAEYNVGHSSGSETASIDASGTDVRSDDKPQKQRTGYQHINESNPSLMPRIKNKIKGYVYNIDYDIIIDTIDDNSGAEKEDKKNAIRVQMEHGKFINQYKLNAGIPVEEPVYLPQSPQELALFESVNGFKLNSAIAMEKILKHSFEISNWDHQIKDLLLDDGCDIGWMAGRVYFDCEDFKFKVKYVDPEYLVVPYSKYHDYSEMPWVGYYEQMTISDLRMEMSDVDEEDIAALAKNGCGKLGNPSSDNWDRLKIQDSYGAYGYDNFLVWVLHTEWIDEEFYSKLEYTSKNNRKSRYIIDEEERASLKEKNKPNHLIVDYNKRKLRMCSWVVDSEHTFDWGLSNFQDRPTKNKVLPSFRIVRLNDKPITELLYPVMDDFKIAWMKFQDGRSMAIKSGYSIDWSMMQNIEDGGKKYSVIELMEMWRDTGILIFQGSLSGKYEGGRPTPIGEIPGNAGILLDESMKLWMFANQKLQDVTGLNPISLGATSGGTATEAQLGVSSTTDILRPLIMKMLNIKEFCAASLTRRLQLGIRFNAEIRKNYEPIVGMNDMQILLDAEKSRVQYGQTFEAKPDDEYKKMILEAAQISLNNRRQGLVGIDLATYTYLFERIMGGGNLKEIRLIIAYQEKKYQEEIDNKAKENIQLQGQENQKLEQIKAQAAQQAMAMEKESEKEKFLHQILIDYYKQVPQEAKAFVAGAMGGEYQDDEQPIPPQGNAAVEGQPQQMMQ